MRENQAFVIHCTSKTFSFKSLDLDFPFKQIHKTEHKIDIINHFKMQHFLSKQVTQT